MKISVSKNDLENALRYLQAFLDKKDAYFYRFTHPFRSH